VIDSAARRGLDPIQILAAAGVAVDPDLTAGRDVTKPLDQRAPDSPDAPSSPQPKDEAAQNHKKEDHQEPDRKDTV